MQAPRHGAGREEGAVAVIAALLITVLLGMGALAIDIASFRLTKRQLQAATDAAALSATWALYQDGGGDPQAWARDYLARNYPGTARLVSTTAGFYCPDSALAASARFPTPSDACAVYPGIAGGFDNAVKVVSATTAPFYLGQVLMPGKDGAPITAEATAAQIPQAGFYAGSGLLALDGGVLNAVLGGLLGGGINLTLTDYNGLLDADVNAFRFFHALATNLGVTAGTYGSLLQTPVAMQDVLQAEVDALNAPQSVAQLGASAVGAATAALVKLQGQITGSPRVRLADLFDLGVWQDQGLGSGSAQTALQTALNVYQLATLAAQVADGANFADIPAFGIDVGLARLAVQATLIEPEKPAIAFGPVGVSVHTAQLRLKLDLSVPVAGNALLAALLGAAPLHVPLYVEVARGDARLAAISCGTDPASDAVVAIDATPGVAKAWIGSAVGDPMTNFATPVDVGPVSILDARVGGGLGLLTVTAKGKAVVSVEPGAATPLTFTQKDIANGAAHRATSNDHLFSTLLAELMAPGGDAGDGLVVQVGGVAGGLLGGLTVNVGAVTAALGGVLQPVFATLDGAIAQVMTAFGVSVGYLDVTATGVRCGAPVLVN